MNMNTTNISENAHFASLLRLCEEHISGHMPQNDFLNGLRSVLDLYKIEDNCNYSFSYLLFDCCETCFESLEPWDDDDRAEIVKSVTDLIRQKGYVNKIVNVRLSDVCDDRIDKLEKCWNYYKDHSGDNDFASREMIDLRAEALETGTVFPRSVREIVCNRIREMMFFFSEDSGVQISDYVPSAYPSGEKNNFSKSLDRLFRIWHGSESVIVMFEYSDGNFVVSVM